MNPQRLLENRKTLHAQISAALQHEQDFLHRVKMCAILRDIEKQIKELESK